MIINFQKFKLITEDPDFVYINDDEQYDMSEDDAVPFECIVNEEGDRLEEIHFGEHGTFHDDIDYYDDRRKAYPGRIWLNSKIMAFWVYPKNRIFKLIVHRIEKQFDIKIFNNNWRIEVIKKKEKIKKKKKQEDFYRNTGEYDKAVVIPLDEYTGSEDVPEQLQIQHLMNWKEKELAKKIGKLHFGGKFGSNLTAWDQPHNIRYRQAIYQENTNFQKFKLITEDPDSIEYNGIELEMDDGDAIPFITDVNKNFTNVEDVYIGNFNDWHDDIYFAGENRAYPGRLWIDHKIISFWVYPDVDLFKQIIKKLEEKLEIKIFNNGWKIEVIYSDNEDIKMKKFDPRKDDDYFSGDDTDYTQIKIISVDKYAGSEDFSEEKQIRHLMNWKEKELAKKFGKIHFGGKFGSNLTAWDQPHNIRYRQAIYQEKKTN